MLVTWCAELTAAPVLLMTWLIVPVPPSDTVTMFRNRTPGLAGTSNAPALTTAGLALKEQ